MNVIQELILPAGDEKPDFEHGSIFFIGTATVIIRYAGFTVLTDPNFLHAGEQVHFNDYNVFKSSLDDFVRAFNASGLENQVHYLYHGQTYTFEKSVSRA